MSELVSQSTAKLLDHYSQYHPSVLSIQQFIDFGEFKGDCRVIR